MRQTHPKAIGPLSDEAYQVFREKGERNAVKVRRVMQITRNLSRDLFQNLRILDLGCGEGVYSIEAGLRGAHVLAIDARMERMAKGMKIACQMELANVQFRQEDVRKISRAGMGEFDVVYFLGLLYHLSIPDVFLVLENVYDMCRHFAIIDTHVSLDAATKATHRGVDYFGIQYKEHEESDPPQVKAARQLSSLDNVYSFWFTKESLNRLLYNTGFTAVLECHVPFEPYKANERVPSLPNDRITLAAIKGPKEEISSYPWINELSEEEIARKLEKK